MSIIIIYVLIFFELVCYPNPSEVSAYRKILKAHKETALNLKILLKSFITGLAFICFITPLAAGLYEVISGGDFWFFEAGVRFLVGFVLALGSRYFSFVASKRIYGNRHSGHDLMDSGLFSVSRHPVTLMYLVTITGLIIMVGNWLLLIPALVFAWIMHLKVLEEEAFLRQGFGDVYVQYCKKVRRYI